MKNIKDYHEFELQICGYVRKSVLSDNDYDEVKKDLYKKQFESRDYPREKIYYWLQYIADIVMLRFYSKKVSKGSVYKKKAFSLYYRIINRYPDFQKEIDIDPYIEFAGYSSPSDVKTYLKSVIAGSYPHQVLIFCYKELLNDWNNNKIISDLSLDTLETIFNRLINEYSSQSGLPCFFVAICFIDLRDKLNKRLKNIILKNDAITPKKMEEFLDWITGSTKLNLYYRNDMEHDITDWSNRVKEKTIINLSQCLSLSM